MDAISILAALDEHYLPQLHVLLTSLRLNNPGEHMDLYLLQLTDSASGVKLRWGQEYFYQPKDDAEELEREDPDE